MSSNPTAISWDARGVHQPGESQISSIGNTQPLQVMSPSTTLEQLGLAGLSPDEALDRLLAAHKGGGTIATTGAGTATALPLTSSVPSSFGPHPQHADRIPMAFLANAIEPPVPDTPIRAPTAAAVRKVTPNRTAIDSSPWQIFQSLLTLYRKGRTGRSPPRRGRHVAG